jgi:hypothetical protein
MPKGNEVGAAWAKTSGNGIKYLSVSLDLDRLMAVTHNQTNGKINLALFKKKGEKTKDTQPDFDLVFSPRQGARQAPSSDVSDESEGDIPF